MRMTSFNSDTTEERPPHDRLSCEVEDFDYDMHIILCTALYDDVVIVLPIAADE